MDILEAIYFVIKLGRLKYFTHFGEKGRRGGSTRGDLNFWIYQKQYIMVFKLGEAKDSTASSKIGWRGRSISAPEQGDLNWLICLRLCMTV